MRKITRHRRLLFLLDGLCIAAIAAGYFVIDFFLMLGRVLMLGWLLCLIVLILLTVLTFAAYCPHCGALIVSSRHMSSSLITGRRWKRPDRCPKCGAILTDNNLT